MLKRLTCCDFVIEENKVVLLLGICNSWNKTPFIQIIVLAKWLWTNLYCIEQVSGLWKEQCLDLLDHDSQNVLFESFTARPDVNLAYIGLFGLKSSSICVSSMLGYMYLVSCSVWVLVLSSFSVQAPWSRAVSSVHLSVAWNGTSFLSPVVPAQPHHARPGSEETSEV